MFCGIPAYVQEGSICWIPRKMDPECGYVMIGNVLMLLHMIVNVLIRVHNNEV